MILVTSQILINKYDWSFMILLTFENYKQTSISVHYKQITFFLTVY